MFDSNPFMADIPAPGTVHDLCEAGCGARVFTAETAFKPHRPFLVEAIPGRPMAFGDEHTPGRCRYLRGMQCCDLHAEPSCCDGNDCGPCCGDCPTCPTLARMRARGVPIAP